VSVSRFVTVDLETRSACDLRAHGGHLYATDPTTRLLCVPWHADGVYHVWLPGVDEVPADLLQTHLPGVTVHCGPEWPPIPTDRPWVGHNCYGFDEPVWKALAPARLQPKRWVDTQCLALAAGLPAGLNNIGERLWGAGKYAEGSKAMKDASRARGLMDCEASDVPIGVTILVARYAVQDVKLTVDLLEHLGETLHLPDAEHRVIEAHRRVNNRGAKVDAGLVSALYRLSNEAVEDAVREIAELTGGHLASIEDLRSRTKMVKWLEELGATRQLLVDAGGGKKKVSLRREVVAKLLAMYQVEDTGPPLSRTEQDDDADEADSGLHGEDMTLACRVLSLRQAAMRITAGKLAAAGNRVDTAGVARGLFAYWAAHTGRWAGRGIQVQNLPRAKEGVPVWPLLRLYETTGTLELSRVRDLLAAEARRKKLPRPATADDAASALIRSLFVPHTGDRDLLAADLASIEVRVLAWLAGEQWLMDEFAKNGDPYIAFCKRVTGETITKKDPRRQVFKVLELGGGYQCGGDTMMLYAAANGVDLSKFGLTAQSAVDSYRDAHPAIAGEVAGIMDGGRRWRRGGFWNDLNDASLAVVRGVTPEAKVGRLTFYGSKGHLYCVLPSGRELVYRSARIVQINKWGKDRPQVVYASPRWRSTSLYGGKIAENVTQAVASDFIRYALVRMEEAGFRVVLHVHDEIVASGDRRRLDEFMTIITEVPPWATGFPLGAEGGFLPRYAKAPPKGKTWAEQTWQNGVRLK
jgi:DNA polymerase